MSFSRRIARLGAERRSQKRLFTCRGVLLPSHLAFSPNNSPVPPAIKKEEVVLRAYDNRAVYTERRPDVYMYSEGLTGPMDTVCDFHYDGIIGSSSSSNLSTDKDFGCIPDGSDRSDWLWADRRKAKCSCRLYVISTPYYPGQHWARSVEEFVPLVDQLEQFHARGLVHGDIRATNTAFWGESSDEGDSSDRTSRLFDWDMGGRVRDGTALKYPEGFRPLVFDGVRAGAARAGKPISKVHDWVALTGLILKLHRIVPKCKEDAYAALMQRREKLVEFGGDGHNVDVGKHVSALKRFLSEAAKSKCLVKLDEQFRCGLLEYGYMEDKKGEENAKEDPKEKEDSQGSGDATGSPSKDRLKDVSRR
jgi:hypothetical protein